MLFEAERRGVYSVERKGWKCSGVRFRPFFRTGRRGALPRRTTTRTGALFLSGRRPGESGTHKKHHSHARGAVGVNRHEETVGIILAGGRGERAKPITLKSPDYIRSKALIPFVGRRLVEWMMDACRAQ